MSDGAHLGITAGDAMKAVIAGDQPEKPPMSAQEMKDWILAADPTVEFDYDECARYAAKLIMEWLLEDPRRAQFPVENEYEKDASGQLVFNSQGGLNLAERGWYDRMKEDGIPLSDLGLSGFMWGWAANAARRCLELPAVQNPAIVTIGDPHE